MMSKMKLRHRILLPFLLCLAILTMSMGYAIYWLQQKDIEDSLNRHVLEVKQTFARTLEQEVEMLKINSELLVANQTSININTLHDAWLKQDREALFTLVKPLYNQLHRTHQITHFYFTSPDRVNFLRVHKPGKYGDLIDRYTTLQAEKTGKAAFGSELGVMGTYTLRYVLPWYWQGKLIAYIELGKEMDENLSRLHEARDIELLAFLDKKNLKQKTWEAGRSLLGHNLDAKWNQFKDVVMLNNSLAIPSDVISALLLKGEAYLTIHGNQYFAKTCPLTESRGKTIGTLIILQKVNEVVDSGLAVMAWLFVFIFIISGTLSVFFYTYLGKIEKNLKQSQKEKVARQAAEEALALKHDFLANMSHELRTPLNVIIGFSELLHQEVGGKLNEEQQEFAQDIFHSGQKLLAMIDQVLELSRLESGQVSVEVSAISTSDLCQSLIHEFVERALEHDIQLTADYDTSYIEVDAKKLKKILAELLLNAIKFTKSSGHICLSMKCVNTPPNMSCPSDSGLYLRASVRDTGIGITKEDIPKLFAPFKQLESAMTKQYHGIGIGLVIAKRLTELLGGVMIVESKLNKGSEFVIYIPVSVVA